MRLTSRTTYDDISHYCVGNEAISIECLLNNKRHFPQLLHADKCQKKIAIKLNGLVMKWSVLIVNDGHEYDVYCPWEPDLSRFPRSETRLPRSNLPWQLILIYGVAMTIGWGGWINFGEETEVAN